MWVQTKTVTKQVFSYKSTKRCQHYECMTIFAALLGLHTGKMNYHNIICRLSAPTQFHSKINEQLLGCNQRLRAVTPGPLWVSRTLTDQPLAVARERSQQRATHRERIRQTQEKGTNDVRSCAAHPHSVVIFVCSVIIETESV